VNLSAGHTIAKEPVEVIELVAGLGVDGDAHLGATVQHHPCHGRPHPGVDGCGVGVELADASWLYRLVDGRAVVLPRRRPSVSHS
jgi:hypothetical protein